MSDVSMWTWVPKRGSKVLDLFQIYPGFRGEMIRSLKVNQDPIWVLKRKCRYIYKYAQLHDDLELLGMLKLMEKHFYHNYKPTLSLNSIKKSVNSIREYLGELFMDQDFVSFFKRLYPIDLKDLSLLREDEMIDVLMLMREADPKVNFSPKNKNTNAVASVAINRKYYSVLEYLCLWALKTHHTYTLEYIYKQALSKKLNLDRIITPNVVQMAMQLKRLGNYKVYDFYYFLTKKSV